MLGAIIDTSGSVILGLTPERRIFAWNRAAEALYQTPRSAAIGMDYVASFVAPEHRAAVTADIAEVLAGKRTLDFEDDSILPDGTRRTLVWNVSRVLGPDGAAVGIVATGQDITSRKEAEEHFRLVFEHASEGLLISDESGVLDCNPAALAMLGFTRKEELIGRRPADFSPPTQPDGSPSDAKSRGLGAETLQQGALTFDWTHQRPDGTLVPVEVSVRHTMLRGRRVSIVAWRDQSRRLELDRARAQIAERLNIEQKLDAVAQLAGGVAHDFNNLLAGIRNSVQLAVNELSPELTVRSDLELALEATDRATTLTARLLAFSRRQTRATDDIDLVTLIREMVPLLRTTLPPTITVKVSAAVDHVHVRADRSQLEEVVINLVLNARDAMPESGALTISVGVDSPSRMALLTVTDDGAGMDESTKLRAFEPFFTTKPVGAATGLGLSVVYGVVAQAGGSVTMDSAPGRGTTIRITLPMPERIAASPVAPVATQALSKPVVLLVDDDSVVRSTTRRLLTRSNFEVMEASNGTEALKIFESDPSQFNVLLSDIRMPGMDGVQLAQRVRSLTPGFPVVFISGFDTTVLEETDALHEVQLLAKPFAADKLFGALRAAIAARVAG